MRGEAGEHVCEEVREHHALISKWDERLQGIQEEREAVELQLARVRDEIRDG